MEVSRPLRWVAIAAAAAVALVVAGAVVVYATVDAQAIVRYAAAEVERLTGRAIVVRGPVSISLWPRIAVVAHDVSIGNPAGSSRPELAHVKVVRGSVATWPLLRSRQVVAEGLELEGADIVLEPQAVAADPSAGARAAPAPANGAATPIRLTGRFALVDAKIAWRPRDGAPVDVVVPRLEVAPQDGGRYAWRGDIEVGGTRFMIDATTGDPVQSLRERLPLDVDATIAGGGIALAARGRVERRDSGHAAVVDATVSWEAGSERIARWSPELAREAGRVSARIDARDRVVTIGGINGTFGPTRFDGNASIDRSGARPTVRGRLHVDAVDLGRERAQRPAAPAGTSPARAPPATQLANLGKVDADVDFVVDRIVLPHGAEATNARGRVVVNQGRLAADPLDADAGGGRITGKLTGDAATSTVHLVLEGRGVELARMLGRLDSRRVASGGATTFAIDLHGPAPSADRFVARASGTIRVDVGTMKLQGIALDSGDVLTRVLDAVNPFRRVDASTELQCLVARLAVQDGVAHAERTLALETSRLAMSASGTIDLGARTLDLIVRPRARKLASMPSVELAEVVRVTGPFAHPSVRLDSMGAAKAALTIGGAIATGGWSLLATPLLNAADDPSPCATARAGGKAQRGAPGTTATSSIAADPLAPLKGLFKR